MISVIAVAALGVASHRPLVLAHYMPWFEAPPVAKSWGWHWTMGKTDPNRVRQGRPEIASHYTPRIGPYDSSDPDVLECQTLQMRLAGIDGVLIDWYGIDDQYDYAAINRNTAAIIKACEAAGLKYGLVYEDQTGRALVQFEKWTETNAIDRGRATIAWAAQTWMTRPGYVSVDDKPVLLIFGPQYFKAEQLGSLLAGVDPQPALYTLMNRQGTATGAFGWPWPKDGDVGVKKDMEAFYSRAKSWPNFIASAYPRFHDFYADAGVHASWGNVSDAKGRTLRESFTRAWDSGAPLIQLVTWNDYGEGTVIEPTREFGYRDLEYLQRKLRPERTPADLKKPEELFRLRKNAKAADRKDELDHMSQRLRGL